MLSAAKNRAKEFGWEFALTKDDISIPAQCPVFNKPFELNTEFAASLDRIDSTRGYTPDNIQVISRKANTMKNNASPAELRLFAEWILKNK